MCACVSLCMFVCVCVRVYVCVCLLRANKMHSSCAVGIKVVFCCHGD